MLRGKLGDTIKKVKAENGHWSKGWSLAAWVGWISWSDGETPDRMLEREQEAEIQVLTTFFFFLHMKMVASAGCGPRLTGLRFLRRPIGLPV